MSRKILIQTKRALSISFLLLLGGTANASCLQEMEAMRDMSKSLEMKCSSTISAGAREDCAIRKRGFAMFQASKISLCDANKAEISAPATDAASDETSKLAVTRTLWRQFMSYLHGF